MALLSQLYTITSRDTAGLIQSYLLPEDILFAQNQLPNDDVCKYLIQVGNLCELKKNLCDLKTVCAQAAKHGQLGILQWARANDAPWDENTCAWASAHGHLKVLQWAWANDAPWDERIWSWAGRAGHSEVLQWVYEKEVAIYGPFNNH